MKLLDHERKHITALRPYLSECTVLLRKNSEFPLKEPCSVALFGNGARRTIKGGTGSGEVNSRYFVNVEDALKDAGFTITTQKWLDDYDRIRSDAKKAFVKRIKAEARANHMWAINYAMGMSMTEPEYNLDLYLSADVAIYVLSRDSGEGNDRRPEKGDVLLTDTEKRDILLLNKSYKKFMLVLNVGGPVDLSGLEEVQNILLLSQLGVETGCALTDILLGKENPSGKLATTWAAWGDYQKIGSFGDKNNTDYTEGIYIGYRYFNSIGVQPLFPFGYGLSYTTFKTEAGPVVLEGDTVSVPVEVTNTGKMPGKEVIQVYVSCPAGKLDKVYQDLAGFEKTKELGPKKSQTVTITFRMQDLASYDAISSSYILEKGDYVVRMGNSSAATLPVAVIRLDKDATVLKAKPCCGSPSFQDWVPNEPVKDKVPSFVPVLKLKASDIEEKTVDYGSHYPIDDAVKKLTDEQLAIANIGTFKEKGGPFSVIGSASAAVAGAAGEVSTRLKDAGFKTMVLADGPAGLRLIPHYYIDEKGQHGFSSSHSESFMEYIPGFVKLLMRLSQGKSKTPKGAKEGYHYCNAIPIGTAIAQSWNTEFARLCGDIVGTEMEMYNVHLWLAPALNIHRSILCGRNFEYYSEDPLISGLMAAFITIGVQSHKGCGTTIKHYAANNQETNRYGCSSNVSERALREIYLKGFGLCVRLSQPKAVMTSYNLLNGKHTAESHDLIESILRCEFGFKGIVMTDWVIGNGFQNNKDDVHPRVRPELTADAGSDLFMPGCKADYDAMLKGLEDGSVSREQLQINATRVYRMGKELSGGKA